MTLDVTVPKFLIAVFICCLLYDTKCVYISWDWFALLLTSNDTFRQWMTCLHCTVRMLAFISWQYLLVFTNLVSRQISCEVGLCKPYAGCLL